MTAKQKIAAIADTHWTERIGLGGGNTLIEVDGRQVRRSLLDADNCAQWIAERIREEQPAGFIHAGDLFHAARPSTNELNLAVSRMLEIAKMTPSILIRGNHDDPAGYESSATSVLETVANSVSWVGGSLEVAERPRVVDIETAGGTVRFYCLPYPPIGRLVSAVDDEGAGWSKEWKNGIATQGLGAILDDFGNKALLDRENGIIPILLSHVTFAGSEYDSGQVVPATDVNAPTARLSDFSAVVAGHLHKRQKIAGLETAYYLGPPDVWEFGSQDETERGMVWLELDFETLSVEWIFEPYPGRRRFMTVSPEQWLDHIALGEESRDNPIQFCSGETSPDNKFIRVRGTVEDLEVMSKIERSVEESGQYCFGSVVLDIGVAVDESETPAVDPAAGLRGIYDAYRGARPDAIPDDYSDDVFESVVDIVARGDL